MCNLSYFLFRSIDLSDNYIDHLDAMSFPTAELTSLNLARNKIKILPDNSFVSLSVLISLNISQNHLRANFKELFHPLPDLRQLTLSNCDLKSIPHLPLKSLNYLDLSYNYINSIRENDLSNVKSSLKVLLLTNNSLTSINGLGLSYLRELDISGNPIKVRITKRIFSSLQSFL